MEVAVQYRLKLFHDYFKSDIPGTVHSLIATMRTVAGLIDAALLENEYSLDFFYFQKAAHCVLTYTLDSHDISDNSGVNKDRIDERIFNRSYYDDYTEYMNDDYWWSFLELMFSFRVMDLAERWGHPPKWRKS